MLASTSRLICCIEAAKLSRIFHLPAGIKAIRGRIPGAKTMQTDRVHWIEYGCEALGLGLFMFSACAFTALLEHPTSALHTSIDSALVRRVLMGFAMAFTLLAIVYSKPGKRSGAHLNPAVTLSFWVLGKVRSIDAAGYVLAQAAGGVLGVLAASQLIGPALGHSAVRYAATVPGPDGLLVAFTAEFAISFLLMSAVLWASNSARYTKLTPFFAAALVAIWITVEAPLSGMSMNPARTLGSALSASVWTGWWIYFTAPPLAMLTAACIYRKRNSLARVYCAKLHHHNSERCIFRCNYGSI